MNHNALQVGPRKNRSCSAMRAVTCGFRLRAPSVARGFVPSSLLGAGWTSKTHVRASILPAVGPSAGGRGCQRGYQRAKSGRGSRKGAASATCWSSVPSVRPTPASIWPISGQAGAATSSPCGPGATRLTAPTRTLTACSRFCATISDTKASSLSTSLTTPICRNIVLSRPRRARTIQPCSSSWNTRRRLPKPTNDAGRGGIA